MSESDKFDPMRDVPGFAKLNPDSRAKVARQAAAIVKHMNRKKRAPNGRFQFKLLKGGKQP